MAPKLEVVAGPGGRIGARRPTNKWPRAIVSAAASGGKQNLPAGAQTDSIPSGNCKVGIGRRLEHIPSELIQIRPKIISARDEIFASPGLSPNGCAEGATSGRAGAKIHQSSELLREICRRAPANSLGSQAATSGALGNSPDRVAINQFKVGRFGRRGAPSEGEGAPGAQLATVEKSAPEVVEFPPELGRPEGVLRPSAGGS